MTGGQSPPVATTTPVKLRIVEFSDTSPELWFATAEALFEANSITDEKGKYSHLLQCLNMSHAERIRSIIIDSKNLNTPYTEAKKQLMEAFGDSEERKLQKLLNTAVITETQPTRVLEQILSLAGNSFSENAIREMFLSRIPIETRIALTPSMALPVMELAKQADTTWELQRRSGIIKPIFAAEASMYPTAATTPVPTTSTTETLLLTAVTELSKQIATLVADNRRSRERSRDQSRTRSRNRSATPLTPELFDGLCWYHDRFGDKARKCHPTCSKYDEMKGN